MRAQEISELSSNDYDDKSSRKIYWSPSADESSLKKSKLPTPPNLIQDDIDLEGKYDWRCKFKKNVIISVILVSITL